MNVLLKHENGLLTEVLGLTEKSTKEPSDLRAIAKRDRKPQEFAEYDAYCEKCKREAKEELGL